LSEKAKNKTEEVSVFTEVFSAVDEFTFVHVDLYNVHD